MRNLTEEEIYEYEYKNLSDYEKEFANKAGYWDEVSIGKRQDAQDAQKEEEEDIGTTIHNIYVSEDKCFVPALGCTLGSYTDIVNIFPSKELINDFFAFLINHAIEDTLNKGSVFYYYKNSQTYNFDYPYILHIIIKWAVGKLKVDPLSFTNFMRQFSPSSDAKFLEPNYFLISIVFGDTYNFLSPSSNAHFRKTKVNKKIIYYYNPTLVRGGDGEEYFFHSIPISANMLLFSCARDTILYLFAERNNLQLAQILFGKAVFAHQEANSFFKINFPKKLKG